MVVLRCGIPGCSFSTPESNNEVSNMVLLLAHTNYHLVSLLIPPPPPPPPSVFPVNLLPPLFPLPPLLRYPVPSVSNTPTVSLTPKRRATASSLTSKRVFSPGHNRRVEMYRRNAPMASELASASNTRDRTVSSISATPTGDLDFGTGSGFIISNVRSIEERLNSPFIYDTPKISKNWSKTWNTPPKDECCEFFQCNMSIYCLNKIVQPKQLTDFWSKTIDCYKQADRPVKNYCLITVTGKRFINLNRAFFPWDYFLLFLRSIQQTKNMVIFGKKLLPEKVIFF